MFDFLEICYLNIKWQDKNTVNRLNSGDSLEIQKELDSNIFFIESVAFPQVYFYLGFHFDEKLKHTPYFELADGKKEELICFESPNDHKKWWIQNSGWNKETKYYNSEIYRSMGTIYLVIQNKKLKIINNYLDFTVEELEHYLSDFKNDLWMLILDKDNPSKGNVEKQIPNFFQEETISLFHDFVETVKRTLQNPNILLSERQNILPIKKVKPVPKTFQDIIANPYRKFATSRDFFESYNTAENRYIHYCTDKILYLIIEINRIAISQMKSYQYKIRNEQNIKKTLLETREKLVDREVFEGEIQTLKNQLSNLDILLNNIKSNKDPNAFPNDIKKCKFIPTTNFILGKKYGKSRNSYFVLSINNLSINEFLSQQGADEVKYGVLVLDDIISDEIDFSYSEIQIAGFYNDAFKRSQANNNLFYEFLFKGISFIDFDIQSYPKYKELNHKQQNLQSRKLYLEKQNWKIALSSEDRREYKKETKLVQKKIELLSFIHDQILSTSYHFPILISQLREICNFLTSHQVKKTPNISNSMVFIQNPNYANCKKVFENILKHNGIELSIFDAMVKIDEIGLVNTSSLYEKWCFIQTIKVLKNVYGFTLESDWQAQLIKSVLAKENNILIKMSSSNTMQNIDLTFEKELYPKGSRPDIVVDLYSIKFLPEYSIDPNQQVETKEFMKRLVLDAKFQNFTQATHDECIDKLYREKNYSEGEKNQVFIIHPKPKIIENLTSPLRWGGFCDYGQSNQKKHKFGGVYLGFSLKYPNSIENLQRLIGAFLQNNSSKYKNSEGRIWHTLHCISCGNSEKSTLNLIHDKTQNDNDKWELKCDRCLQVSKFTLCYKCGNKVYKNGLNWTYHRTRAERVFNVVCPDCESFF